MITAPVIRRIRNEGFIETNLSPVFFFSHLFLTEWAVFDEPVDVVEEILIHGNPAEVTCLHDPFQNIVVPDIPLPLPETFEVSSNLGANSGIPCEDPTYEDRRFVVLKEHTIII